MLTWRGPFASLIGAALMTGCASHAHQISSHDHAREACSEWHSFSVTLTSSHVYTDQLPLAADDAQSAARAEAYQTLGATMHRAVAAIFPNRTASPPHIERLTSEEINAVNAACAAVH